MTGGAGDERLPEIRGPLSRIVSVRHDEEGAVLDLECDGRRYSVRPPELEMADDQTLRAYQGAILIPGDDVIVTPHPASLQAYERLDVLLVPRGVITVPAMRLLIAEGATEAYYTDVVRYVGYTRASLGKFCDHLRLRRMISGRHAGAGACNRIVLEKPIAPNSYIIGDSIHLCLRNHPMPETAINGMVGCDIDSVVSHPLTDGAGIVIIGTKRDGSDLILELEVPSLTFAEGLDLIREAEGRRP